MKTNSMPISNGGPTWSFFKGFSARLRYARVHQYQGPRDTLNEYRAIFNYDFGLL